jgi:hypothetical protein
MEWALKESVRVATDGTDTHDPGLDAAVKLSLQEAETGSERAKRARHDAEVALAPTRVVMELSTTAAKGAEAAEALTAVVAMMECEMPTASSVEAGSAAVPASGTHPDDVTPWRPPNHDGGDASPAIVGAVGSSGTGSGRAPFEPTQSAPASDGRAASPGRGISHCASYPTINSTSHVSADISGAAGGGTDKMKYQLASLIRHTGTHAGRGHYICDVRNVETDSWKCFNDTHVSDVAEKDLFGQARMRDAYVLFYVHGDFAGRKDAKSTNTGAHGSTTAV